MKDSGKRYSTLPSMIDVPPSGRGVNCWSFTPSNTPCALATESAAVFGSHSRIASVVRSHGVPEEVVAPIRDFAGTVRMRGPSWFSP